MNNENKDDVYLKPARITPLDSAYRNTVSAYFGEPVFDQTGRYLLYAGFNTLEEAAVVVRDMESGQEKEMARMPHVSYHANAQRWVCADRGVYFVARHNGRSFPAIAWLDEPGRVQIFETLAGHSVRRVSADGRRGYGIGQAGGDGRTAIRRIHFESGQAETLWTADDILDALSEECSPRDIHWRFSHPVPNSAETLLFVKFERPKPWTRDPETDFPDWGTFLVLDLQSGAIRSFGKRISGHPYWMPDNQHILNIKMPLDGSGNRHLVVVDADTGEDRRLVDQPIEGPGHPSVSPCGKWFVTDAFTADGRAAPIYVGPVAGGEVCEIARLPHAFGGGDDATAITRGQPHPVWSACGRRVAVNCNFGGDHMGLLLLDDFLPPQS